MILCNLITLALDFVGDCVSIPRSQLSHWNISVSHVLNLRGNSNRSGCSLSKRSRAISAKGPKSTTGRIIVTIMKMSFTTKL